MISLLFYSDQVGFRHLFLDIRSFVVTMQTYCILVFMSKETLIKYGSSLRIVLNVIVSNWTCMILIWIADINVPNKYKKTTAN